MRVSRVLVASALILAAAGVPSNAGAQAAHLELKWMRDSGEFQGLVQQTYRAALESVARQLASSATDTSWAVILDVDETVLDNIVYQLELAAYGTSYDTASWNAWVRREAAVPLPGVSLFLRRIREMGGRVAFVSNRTEWVREETRRNLAAHGLWRADDLLCLEVPGQGAYTKRARREEIRAGRGRCAWDGEPTEALAYLGDNLNDFPAAGEEQGAFGGRWFVLPNPAYGSWQRRVTRRR